MWTHACLTRLHGRQGLNRTSDFLEADRTLGETAFSLLLPSSSLLRASIPHFTMQLNLCLVLIPSEQLGRSAKG